MNIWSLERLSFEGTVPGATHSYGVLIGPEGKYKLVRVLSEEAAHELNESNRRFGREYGISYEEGEPTEIFNSAEQCYEAAVVAFRHMSEPGDLLLEGNSSNVGPRNPLDGPDDALDLLRPIWELDESETSNRWTDIRQQAEDQWAEAIKTLGAVRPDWTNENLGDLRVAADKTVTHRTTVKKG